MAIEEIRKNLNRARTTHANIVARTSKIAKGVLVIGGAAVAGLCQFITWSPHDSPTAAEVIGMAATFIVAIGGVYVLFTEQEAVTAIEVASNALEEVALHAAERAELSEYLASFDRASETYRMCLTLRDAIEESTVVSPTVDDLVKRIFELASRLVWIAAGFESSDPYTIGIYKAVPTVEPHRHDLKCLVQSRAIPCLVEDARVWPEGIGITGIAYSNAREVIVPDLREEGMAAIFGPKNLTKRYDRERYVSMAAVPIMVTGQAKPWGVLNATSDREDHFSALRDPGFKSDEPLRALAAFIGLAISVQEALARSRANTALAPRG